jgi:hypothetical protein
MAEAACISWDAIGPAVEGTTIELRRKATCYDPSTVSARRNNPLFLSENVQAIEAAQRQRELSIGRLSSRSTRTKARSARAAPSD